ncbi:hypothetical protein CEXT_712691 [Caerostris extrusa]|uniref:Uncharacterized protein n=1 Tax=Caerostris extrusa TaxID=172846 RepID=A0AAV4XUZ2_CAEEX|nr:hypothetical protein CEXT_712691 [Caerostris extrusa]
MKLILAISVDVCNLFFGWKLEFMNGEGENGKSKLAIVDQTISTTENEIFLRAAQDKLFHEKGRSGRVVPFYTFRTSFVELAPLFINVGQSH